MTREDIIRMAREAGWDMEWGGTTVEQVMAFAEVVAAAEREECARLVHGIWVSGRNIVVKAIRARGDA